MGWLIGFMGQGVAGVLQESEMKLDNLEKLAKAAEVQNGMLVNDPQTVLAMIALLRQMREALVADPDMREGKTEDALAAFDSFERGE